MNLRGAHIGHEHRGLSHGRLGGHRVALGFLLSLVVFSGLGAAIVALVGPVTKPVCQPYRPCGAPPSSSPLVNQTVWSSTQYGYSLEYPGDIFTVTEKDPAGVVLSVALRDGTTAAIMVKGSPAGQASPSQSVTAALGGLQGVTQIASDSNPASQVLGASVGHRAGAGGAYTGDLTAPQGVNQQEALVAESASDGNVNVTAIVVAAAADSGYKSELYRVADAIINSVSWGPR